jgi:CSLREA domain-containing protein
LLFALAQAATAATFTVTSTADTASGSCGANCTLRDAIIAANATPGADTINFNIGGSSGLKTIAVTSPLPVITDTVTIDGYTQPGASANTLGLNAGNNAVLNIQLSGAGAGDSVVGLRISTSNSIIRGLIINNFSECGIRIDTGTGNTVAGNFIGTNAAGNAASGNFNRGILIVGSTGNFVGDGTNAGRNLISGNFGTGISITGGGSANVSNNYIGTNAAGTAAIPNTQAGIRIADSSNSTIGSATTGAGNVISGNDSHGIEIVQSALTTAASGNLVIGNLIGLAANGTAALGNTGSGVLINAGGNTVGGTNAVRRNVISANKGNGVSISTSYGANNLVQGNYIGTATDGTTALANRDNGVQISGNAAGNTIGGAGVMPGSCNNACNVIAVNGDVNAQTAKAGIYLDTTAGVSNALRGNSIYGNNGIGIDLGAVGKNPSNPAGGAGPNNLQNAPTLSAASSNNQTVTGTLNSRPNGSYVIEFFLNTTADGVNSQGRTFIGSINVNTDANGAANILFNSSVPLPVGQFVTATATATSNAFAGNGTDAPQAIGDTSEFSNAQIITVSTAATANIAGRITNSAGRPLRGVFVRLLNLQTGETLVRLTDVKGRYVFAEQPIGSNYVLTPTFAGYQFSPPSQLISLTSAIDNQDFVAVRVKSDDDTGVR